MAVDIETKELKRLHGIHGTAKKVSEYLQGTGINIAERTIQTRLAIWYPGYADKNTTNKPDKVDDRPVAGGVVTSPDKRRRVLEGKKYVFTTAQNNTYVHKKFFKALESFCLFNNAQLVVSTITYNKNGFQNGTKGGEDLWYDPVLKPYIVNESCRLGKGLIFCGELDILPTAVNPLSGFENYTQELSGIVPHTKVQMQSLPRAHEAEPRFMYTTGACTLRNYIQRKAGQKAEFHHVFGALYAEIDEEGNWFCRQLIADEDGVFHDLTNRYSAGAMDTDIAVSAVTWGDIHHEKLDKQVFQASWGDKESMLQVLQPKWQFFHDLTDFRARNHHNIHDPYHLAEMFHNKMGNVRSDLIRSGKFLNYVTRFGNKAIVVDSNHDQALERWLREADVRKDPENAEFFHTANAMIHKNIRLRNDFHVYQWAVTDNGTIKTNADFLREDDSFLVHGIEHGLHGHRGPNGARGNPRGFRCIGRKVNIGHTHSAGIFDGVYVAGVSGKLDMGYNKGPSSWSHSHIVTYANGKRAIVTIKDGKWRA